MPKASFSEGFLKPQKDGKGGLSIDALLGDYVVAAGGNVTAGGFIKYFNGQVKAWEDEVTLMVGPMLITGAQTYNHGRVIALTETTLIFVYRASSASYLVVQGINFVNGGYVTTTSQTPSGVFSGADVIAVSSTKFVISTRDGTSAPYPGYLFYYSYDGTTVSLIQQAPFGELTSLENSRILKLSDTLLLLIYSDNINSGQFIRTVTIGGTLTINTRVAIANNVITSMLRSDMKLMAPGVVMYAYSDAGDTSKLKASIITISGTIPTVGTPVIINAGNTYAIGVGRVDSLRALILYTIGGVCYFNIISIETGSIVTVTSNITLEAVSTNGWSDIVEPITGELLISVMCNTDDMRIKKVTVGADNTTKIITTTTVKGDAQIRASILLRNRFNAGIAIVYASYPRIHEIDNRRNIYGVSIQPGAPGKTIKAYTIGGI